MIGRNGTLEVIRHRHFTSVQKKARHHLYRPPQGIGRVTRTFHENQKLDDPCFFLRALQVELIGEPTAGRRNIGKAEFSSLIELAYNGQLRSVDLNPKI
jgi:hypothetical protein